MKLITFNRLAQRELDEAVGHYDAESAGLGDRFLEETQLALTILSSILRQLQGFLAA